MKSKKLPKKNTGNLASQDDGPIRPGVKLAKEKRSKKPSIYDERDDFETYNMYGEDDDYQDETDEAFDEDLDEDEDRY